MNRKGIPILYGAVALSLLLSPGMKSIVAPHGPNPGNSHASKPGRGAQTGGGNNSLYPTRSEVEARASEDYTKALTDLIGDECRNGSNPPPRCAPQPSDFIIALLPDPAGTHVALQFDRAVEAIEEALQDDGFIFDHRLMPWDPKVHPESDDYESRMEADWYEEAKHDFPGLMIFRGGERHPDEWKFVFVVSETPTGGIRKKQFLKAVEEMRAWSGKDLSLPETWGTNQGADRPGLRILGPTFSGSLSSLQKLLTCPQLEKGHCYPLVSVHSGTVTNREAIVGFDQWGQERNIHFTSLQENDEVMIERFVEFLTGEGYDDSGKDKDYRHYATQNMAILSEDETAYGIVRPREGTTTGSGKIYCEEAEGAKDQYCALKLYFPREISQLRAAYQDSLPAPDANDSRSQKRDTLPQDFSVPGSDEDTVPAYSPKQMPLSQEAVMLGIVSELRKHEIEYVILRATDPMDALFLSEYLRTAFPQGRIVTIGADLLFRREAADPRLHGVLALSTYALSPSANHNFASYEDNRVERVFPSTNAAGTYNAMLSLLQAWATGDPTPPKTCTRDQEGSDLICPHILRTHRDEKNPSAFLRLYQYGSPYEWAHTLDYINGDPKNTYDAPPVRLMALGRDEYWPLADLRPLPPPARSKSGTKPPFASTLPLATNQFHGELDAVKIPNSWRVVQLIALALAGAFTFCLWFSSVFSRTQAVAMSAPVVRDSRTTAILVAGLMLLLIMLILLWPSLQTQISAWAPEVVLRVAILAVLITTTLELADRSLVHAFLFLGISTFFIIRVVFIEPPENSAFVLRYGILRAMQLASGLSFIMPVFFFLTVWLWWSYHMTAGLALLDDRRPRLPSGMHDEQVAGLEEENFEGLRHAFKLGAFDDVCYWLVVIGLIGGFWLLRNHYHPIMTLERPLLERIMSVFFAVAIAGVVGVTFTLWKLWVGTRSLLLALDSMPLRREFKSIEGFSWKPIWHLGAGTLEEFRRILAREREALDCAVNTVPIDATALNSEWKATLASYAAAKSLKHCFLSGRSRRRDAERQLLEKFGRYQTALGRVAGGALDYLAWAWAQQKEEANSSTENAISDPKVRACERFVCLVYVTYLLVILIRIRTLIVAIGGMYVLTLIGITQYPFEPKGAIQFLLAVLLIFVVVVVGTVFAQMFRDATLSDLTDTNPGELGRDFWVRMAGFVALPLLSFFTSQVPALNQFFYSWLQPAIEALNR